jgi:hypothetical protein
LTFSGDIQRMQVLCRAANNTTQHSNRLYPAEDLLPDLVLLYPGRLRNSGDYRLEYKGAALTHIDIVNAVHNCTINGHGEAITNFLVDIYQNGLNAGANYNISIQVNDSQLSLEEFKHLVYWIILQEDINYPRPNNMGIRMPIIRYIEGAIAAEHPDILNLATVWYRTNNHGRRPEPPFIHPEVNIYLTDNLRRII